MAQVTLRKVRKKYAEVLAFAASVSTSSTRNSSCWSGPRLRQEHEPCRMIAGLEEISDGDIAIGGDAPSTTCRPRIGTLPWCSRTCALPHMNVYENMSFGLKLKRTPKRTRSTGGQAAAQILDITDSWIASPSSSRAAAPAVAMGRPIVRDSQGVPVRRAVVQPRRQAARADAHRDQEGAPEGAHHHRLCDA